MNRDSYNLSRSALRALADDLVRPIEAATLLLVRTDERLARSDPVLADGARARAHLFEAQALAQMAGEMVSLEDLVLHEAGMDIRAPSTGVARAMRILIARRSLARRAPEDVLAPEALASLLGLPAQAGDEPPEPDMAAAAAAPPVGAAAASRLRDPHRPPADDDEEPWLDEEADEEADEEVTSEGDDDGAQPPMPAGKPDLARLEDSALSGELAALDAVLARAGRTLKAFAGSGAPAPPPSADAPLSRLGLWLAALEAAEAMPAVLTAAIALDAWLLLEPAPRGGDIGHALAGTVLRRRGLAAHHLPALGLGLRRGRFRWSPHQPHAVRLAGLIAAIAGSARLADADVSRLSLAREVMVRRCEGRRGNSRLPQFVDLFIASPLVTVALAAEALGVTPQAIEAMLKELGPGVPRELTGRKRYRAWGIV